MELEGDLKENNSQGEREIGLTYALQKAGMNLIC